MKKLRTKPKLYESLSNNIDAMLSETHLAWQGSNLDFYRVLEKFFKERVKKASDSFSYTIGARKPL